jgi:hypothetical protein
MCAFAGLRFGEDAAVQLTDIDFLRRSLEFSGRCRGQGRVKWPFLSRSTVQDAWSRIPDGLVQVLAQYVEYVVHVVHQWLFIRDDGLPPHENTTGDWGRTKSRLRALRHPLA